VRRDGVAASLRGMLLHWATGTILYYVRACVCISTALESAADEITALRIQFGPQGNAPLHLIEKRVSPLMNIFSSSLLAQRRNSNHAPVIGFFNFCIPPSSLGRGLS
jgi:hypothetical protein